MSRLDEIINTVTANGMREITVERTKQIAVEYAAECVKAYLEKAMVQVAWNFNDSDEGKKAITNPENITLL